MLDVEEMKGRGLTSYNPRQNRLYRQIMYAIEDAVVEDKEDEASEEKEEKLDHSSEDDKVMHEFRTKDGKTETGRAESEEDSGSDSER